MLATIASKLDFQSSAARLRRSSFVRNVLIVMSGTAIAQAVGFALSPVISRLFSPADFGVFGSFSSVAGIILAGATLDYSQAVMVPKDKEDALNLFAVSCVCTLLLGFVCFVGCLVAPGTINGLLKTSGAWALALLVLATVAGGFNASCQAWCVRVKSFKHTSASQVVRSLSANSLQLGLGWLKAGPLGLILSDVLADLLATLNLMRVLRRDLKVLRPYVHWQRMWRLAKRCV